jgi:FKBP-type peptidyl-prolyl cis-trans isomerase
MNRLILQILWFFVLCVTLSSCLGDDPFQKQKQLDSEVINGYVATNNLKGITTNSGLFYAITFADTGRNAVKTLSSNIVEISYDLYTLDDKKITSQTNYVFKPATGSFFAGLSEGILFVKNKEKATFLLPSSLALGNNLTKLGNVSIPPNTVLRLDVTVIAVRKDEAEQEAKERQDIERYMANTRPVQTATRDTLEKTVVYVRKQANPTGLLLKDKTETTIEYSAKRVADGSEFRKETLVFEYNTLVPNGGLPSGLITGLRFMRTGETGTIYLTSSRAFRDVGINGVLAPYSTIFYEITSIKQ